MSSPAPEPEVLQLAKKLVGLAKAQNDALKLGAKEQFGWLILRRDETTSQLSNLLAAGVAVSDADSNALAELRTELLALDDGMKAHLKNDLAELGRHRRRVQRTSKTVGSYLSLGPRRSGFFDKQQ